MQHTRREETFIGQPNPRDEKRRANINKAETRPLETESEQVAKEIKRNARAKKEHEKRNETYRKRSMTPLRRMKDRY